MTQPARTRAWTEFAQPGTSPYTAWGNALRACQTDNWGLWFPPGRYVFDMDATHPWLPVEGPIRVYGEPTTTTLHLTGAATRLALFGHSRYGTAVELELTGLTMTGPSVLPTDLSAQPQTHAVWFENGSFHRQFRSLTCRRVRFGSGADFTCAASLNPSARASQGGEDGGWMHGRYEDCIFATGGQAVEHFGGYPFGGGSLTIERCEMRAGQSGRGNTVYAHDANAVTVRDSTFDNDGRCCLKVAGVKAEGIGPGVTVERCRFLSGKTGVELDKHGPKLVRGCSFSAAVDMALKLAGGADVEDCLSLARAFIGQMGSVDAAGTLRRVVTARDCRIQGADSVMVNSLWAACEWRLLDCHVYDTRPIPGHNPPVLYQQHAPAGSDGSGLQTVIAGGLVEDVECQSAAYISAGRWHIDQPIRGRYTRGAVEIGRVVPELRLNQAALMPESGVAVLDRTNGAQVMLPVEYAEPVVD